MSKIQVRVRHSIALARVLTLIAGCLLASRCKKGETPGAGIDIRNAGATYLTLLSQSPGKDETQVPLSAAIQLTFDGAIHPDGLDTQVIRIQDSKGKTVTGSFLTRSGGRVVLFQPYAPLERAEDYSISIDTNLCDTAMRAMERSTRTQFRTLDETAPEVARVVMSGSKSASQRTGSFQILFNERIDPKTVDPSSVQVLDSQGVPQSLDLALIGKSLVVDLVRDLPGSTKFQIRLTGGKDGIADISGNRIEKDWFFGFTTQFDGKSPELSGMNPPSAALSVSPRARFSYRFTESLAPVRTDSIIVQMVEEKAKAVSISHSLSRDGRTLHVQPDFSLQPGKSYKIQLQGGSLGIRDVSGNILQQTYSIPFTVGNDVKSPSAIEQSPEAAQDPVSLNVRLQVTFDEPLDPASVTSKSFRLYEGSELVSSIVSMVTGDTILLLPTRLLKPATQYRVHVKSGYDGILDLAGNPMEQALDFGFRTGKDSLLPEFDIYPLVSSSSVPIDAEITFIANTELLPSTVTKENIRILAGGGTVLEGTLTLERGNRVIRFDPKGFLPPLTVITTQIKGGPKGVRLANGNWLTTDSLTSFRSGLRRDSGSKPQFRFSFNGIAPERMGGIHLPPSGFSIDISAYDSTDGSVDMGSLQLTLQGPDIVPTAQELFALTTFEANNGSLRIGKGFELPVGKYKISAKVADSAGNESQTESFDFTIDPPMSGDVPFETTQYIQVRFDLDRENNWKGNGIPDFDGDLYDLGLLASGDPIGTNSYMRRLLIDGILGVANRAYGREFDGSSQPGSVNIRFLSRKPCGNNYMQIAVGGMDPSGSSKRRFGDKTTGILGRAWFDYKNQNYSDNNTGTQPGLGVFTGELFLHQARIYLDLKTWYLSTWGRTYDGLSPHLNGTPVGRHVLDAKILAPAWNYQSGSGGQKARWDEIMRAADDFARVVGTILAHEVGHSVGLVAPGGLPGGLHGDNSLHNSTSGLGDIMSAVIGYEGLLVVDHRFRSLSMSYLRQSLLLK